MWSESEIVLSNVHVFNVINVFPSDNQHVQQCSYHHNKNELKIIDHKNITPHIISLIFVTSIRSVKFNLSKY